MHAVDIKGSIAYAKALARVGILTNEEKEKIIAGLVQVGEEWELGTVSRHSTIHYALPYAPTVRSART